jgi:hypothetical protein
MARVLSARGRGELLVRGGRSLRILVADQWLCRGCGIARASSGGPNALGLGDIHDVTLAIAPPSSGLCGSGVETRDHRGHVLAQFG